MPLLAGQVFVAEALSHDQTPDAPTLGEKSGLEPHPEDIAFDIAMANHDPEAFEAAARSGSGGFGFYPRSTSSTSTSGRREMLSDYAVMRDQAGPTSCLANP